MTLRETVMTPADSTSDEMEGRQALVEASLPELFEAYDAAVAADMDTPVVFLIDCEDSIGGEIARAWEGEDAEEAAILGNAEVTGGTDASAESEKITTTLAKAYSFDESRQQVPQLFPYLRDSFAQPPSDGFLIVVVSYNGAATLTAPLTARPS